jgi:hypothetical protein
MTKIEYVNQISNLLDSALNELKPVDFSYVLDAIVDIIEDFEDM